MSVSKRVHVGGFGDVRVDLTTKRVGGSSVNQFVVDPNTRVYFGHEACVTFLELGLEVKMDPYKGDWKNAKWARDEAWKAMLKHFKPEDLKDIIIAAVERGRMQGEKQTKARLRSALGIESSGY